MAGPLDRLTQAAGDWGQTALDAADYIRYGTGAPEKLALTRQQALPGAPAPYLPTLEDSPSARRYTTNYLATQRWGPGLTQAGNFTRYLLDGDPDAYVAGQSAQMHAQSNPDYINQPTVGQQQAAFAAAPITRGR
jgi:hypothetical protein